MTEIGFQLYQKSIRPPFVVMKPQTTEKEFFEFADEDISCELIDGVLLVHSPASIEHERIFRFLLILLDSYLRRIEGGEVLGSHAVMRLGPRDIPEPDLMVVMPSSKGKIRKGYLDGSADFVVEILSPSTRDTDLEKKVPLYLGAGVQEVWIVDPNDYTLTVYSPTQPRRIFAEKDVVASSVISGFWIQLDWLWPETSADPTICLDQILGHLNQKAI